MSGISPEQWRERYESMAGGAVTLGEKVTHTERTVRISPVHGPDQKVLLGEPDAEGADLPLSGKDLDKFRGPKEFMDAARRYLDPEKVGPAFADAFIEALKQQNAPMLRVLAPYILGAPAKMEDTGEEDAMTGLINALAGGTLLKKQTRKRLTVVENGVPNDILEATGDEHE